MKLGRFWFTMAAITLVVGLFQPAITSGQDLQRGLKNYQDMIEGRKKLEQLSPPERQEVIIIHRRITSRGEGSGNSECREARARAESAAADLADYAKRLRNCAEAQDLSDDCSTEFRRVRNAHSDYEDAVSAISTICN